MDHDYNHQVYEQRECLGEAMKRAGAVQMPREVGKLRVHRRNEGGREGSI
jgi:hypothetical protein